MKLRGATFPVASSTNLLRFRSMHDVCSSKLQNLKPFLTAVCRVNVRNALFWPYSTPFASEWWMVCLWKTMNILGWIDENFLPCLRYIGCRSDCWKMGYRDEQTAPLPAVVRLLLLGFFVWHKAVSTNLIKDIYNDLEVVGQFLICNCSENLFGEIC